jgi:hypothetical protein
MVVDFYNSQEVLEEAIVEAEESVAMAPSGR